MSAKQGKTAEKWTTNPSHIGFGRNAPQTCPQHQTMTLNTRTFESNDKTYKM
jgi:hypothetical protein